MITIGEAHNIYAKSTTKTLPYPGKKILLIKQKFSTHTHKGKHWHSTPIPKDI